MVLAALDCACFRPDVSLEVPLRAVCCRLDRQPTNSHAPPGGAPVWNVHTVICVCLPWEHGETYQQAIREVKTCTTESKEARQHWQNRLRVVGRMMGGC